MDVSYDVLRIITSSRLRLNILNSLESPMRLSDLRRAVNSNAPNTSSKAKDLQRLDLIKRDNGDYRITRMGRIVNGRISALLDTLAALYKHREFWSRIIDNLPDEIISSIHEFKEARLLANDRRCLDRVRREILRRVKQAEGELLLVMPADSEEILGAAKEVSSRVKTRLVTLEDEPGLRYGLASAGNFKILFTEMLDMALVRETCSSSPSKSGRSP